MLCNIMTCEIKNIISLCVSAYHLCTMAIPAMTVSGHISTSLTCVVTVYCALAGIASVEQVYACSKRSGCVPITAVNTTNGLRLTLQDNVTAHCLATTTNDVTTLNVSHYCNGKLLHNQYILHSDLSSNDGL